jgi:hypothetical protein
MFHVGSAALDHLNQEQMGKAATVPVYEYITTYKNYRMVGAETF